MRGRRKEKGQGLKKGFGNHWVRARGRKRGRGKKRVMARAG